MSHSNTPPVRNRAPLTARSSSLRCVSAVEHQTAEQYSKTGRTKPQRHLPRTLYHETLARTSSRYQVFAKLLSAFLICMSLVANHYNFVRITVVPWVVYVCLSHRYLYIYIYIYIQNKCDMDLPMYLPMLVHMISKVIKIILYFSWNSNSAYLP